MMWCVKFACWPLNNFCPSDGMSQVQFLEVMCLYKEATGFLVKKLLVPCELYCLFKIICSIT